MDIQTHIAIPSEVDEIVALWKRFCLEETVAVPDANLDGNIAGWTKRLRKQIPASKIVVASHGNNLVGFLGFIDDQDWQNLPTRTAYVVDLYVVPEARKSTAAYDLFRLAKQLMRSRYSTTWANTHINNKRMQTLLKRWGFEPLETFSGKRHTDQIYYKMDYIQSGEE